MGYRSKIIALMSGASLAALAAPAFAQAADPAAEAAVEEVVVTGSRIARTTFETPTPVTAVTEQQLEAKAASTVVELLRDVPALRPNQIQGGGRSIGVSNFNMRSLGASRTLVLLDGQRLMDTSPVGGFDVNVIPAPLISRVEIVTAGASSVYGSDAVTGVVNVILSNNLDGGKAEFQYGISSRGDQETVTASLALGDTFHEDRGRFLFAASYTDRPEILYQGAPWVGRRRRHPDPQRRLHGHQRPVPATHRAGRDPVADDHGRGDHHHQPGGPQHPVRPQRPAEPVPAGDQRGHRLDAGRRGPDDPARLRRDHPLGQPAERVRPGDLRHHPGHRGADRPAGVPVARGIDEQLQL
ncbi:TonB-dependent siderophore receptor [Phenylobacterium sp. J367]|uniref:TonB-dependent receptor plug domain-containing protein n=1 Tax=Phenylobacterium sp. J367 TaxID=2898435 RepID=UPI002151036F|nr:TonB-dependent receptor plug domain-containing protein [Phenylobacterium sp. J367]MCR5877216.1 TonB-dependent receptor plug domain-containing protein [Phenylobacterium sp. J367]